MLGAADQPVIHAVQCGSLTFQDRTHLDALNERGVILTGAAIFRHARRLVDDLGLRLGDGRLLQASIKACAATRYRQQ